MCLIFKLKTRMVDVKTNFRMFYSDLLCRICKKEEENQEHLLFCEKVIESCPELFDDTSIIYKDIFSDKEEKLLKVIKLFKSALEIREILEQRMDNS